MTRSNHADAAPQQDEHRLKNDRDDGALRPEELVDRMVNSVEPPPKRGARPIFRFSHGLLILMLAILAALNYDWSTFPSMAHATLIAVLIAAASGVIWPLHEMIAARRERSEMKLLSKDERPG